MDALPLNIRMFRLQKADVKMESVYLTENMHRLTRRYMQYQTVYKEHQNADNTRIVQLVATDT